MRMNHPPALFARPFYFMRHGETEANANGVVSGSLDVELTALGREQAQAAARMLACEPINAVYSSPLRRAWETAEPIAQILRLPITIVAQLAERRRGGLEGRTAGSVVEDGRSESFEDFAARVLDGLSQVDSPVPLLVAHLGVYRVLCRLLQPGCAEDLLGNALPLRFVLLCDRRWRVEALHRTIGETLS